MTKAVFHIVQCGLNSTSRPKIKPTLNRVQITTDNPRLNSLYIECRVKPSYPDVTLVTGDHVAKFLQTPKERVLIASVLHFRTKCVTIGGTLIQCGLSLH